MSNRAKVLIVAAALALAVSGYTVFTDTIEAPALRLIPMEGAPRGACTEGTVIYTELSGLCICGRPLADSDFADWMRVRDRGNCRHAPIPRLRGRS